MTTVNNTDLSTGLVHRKGRWIDGWNPEDESQWEGPGRAIARRNLVVSVFAEFFGFMMLGVWSIVVPNLGDAGFDYTSDQLYWLIALPGLTGAAMRILYTFMVPVFGGRNWTVISSLLLLIPAAGLAWAVSDPSTPFAVMLLIASLAGFGGGNFASSMVNISFFYPQREKGKALGINAAGGNLGTGIVQLVVPLIITSGAGIALERAGLIFIPAAILSALAALLLMNNLSNAASDLRSYALAVHNHHTWVISFLYIGTFGSFLGFSLTFPTLMKAMHPDVPIAVAFLGAATGALMRPFGGALADRLGGTRVTMASYLAMGVGVVGLVLTLDDAGFGLFLGLFLLLFGAAGIGNGSVYRMIPIAFQIGVRDVEGRARGHRAAAGCIGIAGAVGALGSFFVPRTFAELGITGGLWAFAAVYAVMLVVAWGVYARPGTDTHAARV
ncbi:MFS transporter [Aeromicrobium flavum]|uniref:MFS transporter n=1 Tax=Aeromicrobium flavum TaxID=416568 RepID=A0A512HVE9_9ACTN|nr:MFS transporter [Aeromicrobium flavum]GEO89427.1 MFS transporter [Aeromicrobium flavum]